MFDPGCEVGPPANRMPTVPAWSAVGIEGAVFKRLQQSCSRQVRRSRGVIEAAAARTRGNVPRAGRATASK